MRGIGLWAALVLVRCGFAAPDPLQGDDRLAQPLSVSHAIISLEDLAKELTDRSGVAISASADTRDMKAAAFIRSLPMRHVMSAIASTFDLTWERSGSEPEWKYKLIQSKEQKARKTAPYEFVLRRDRDRGAKSLKDFADHLPDDYAGDCKKTAKLFGEVALLQATMPEGWQEKVEQLRAEAAKCPVTDLPSYMMGYIGRQMTPQNWDTFWAGQDISVDVHGANGLSLPPNIAELGAQPSAKDIQRFEFWAAANPTQSQGLSPQGPGWSADLTFTMRYDPDEGGLAYSITSGSSYETSGHTPLSASYRLTDDELREAGIQLGIPTYDETVRYISQTDELGKVFQPPLEPTQTSSRWKTFGDRLEVLFDHTDLSFLAETTRTKCEADFARVHATTLRQVLEMIVAHFAVSLDDHIVMFRDRQFYANRAREIPERLLVPLEAKVASRASLDYDGWAEFGASLALTQAEALRLEGRNSSIPLLATTNMYAWEFTALRLWASLDKRQRAAAEKRGGLPFRSLSPSQQVLYLKAARYAGGPAIGRGDPRTSPSADLSLRTRSVDSGYVAIRAGEVVCRDKSLDAVRAAADADKTAPKCEVRRARRLQVQLCFDMPDPASAVSMPPAHYEFDVFEPLDSDKPLTGAKARP